MPPSKKKPKLESDFKSDTLQDIRDLFPGCEILHNDANFIQAIPDTLVVHGPNYAFLEFKRHATASKRVNQEYYIKKFNEMSYASFISPENKEAVLNELQSALGTPRASRAPKR
ncbi:VRR-Nuc domain protein [Arthrobacter phage CastorTray]|uniref:VRR-Nuc domain protein n=3 Tax=Gordonvirus TaxID=1982152 RepID=A0A9E7NI88_9CAUD|nr:VRR-Nuc domain protein [Arthrobacter phage CastorTray]YP_010750448.1 nuclease [Arthrobacter phage Trustiboi]YP_010750537.1 nuclease [Arthrobacter phage Darby]QYC55072.1 VRR-Nuc domain protein [Arthrobacter phage CastorTray]UTN91647.1 VRR-Nuc domain protein [Arthrobacter phage Trustiboi]UTN92089.1 VRR-Nuc domain protein [Arthrobacter phage Darby]